MVSVVSIKGQNKQVEREYDAKKKRTVSPSEILQLIKDINKDHHIVRRVKNEVTKSKGVNLVKTKVPEKNEIRLKNDRTFNIEVVSKHVDVIVDTSAIDKHKKSMQLSFGRYQRIHTMIKFIKTDCPKAKNMKFYINNEEISKDIYNKSINYVMDLYKDVLKIKVC
jgi:hypothetical protein